VSSAPWIPAFAGMTSVKLIKEPSLSIFMSYITFIPKKHLSTIGYIDIDVLNGTAAMLIDSVVSRPMTGTLL
jgi:hypothetical protein